MSSPNTNTQILPFKQRVRAVAGEVAKRVADTRPEQKTAIQARLWCQWLAREVL